MGERGLAELDSLVQPYSFSRVYYLYYEFEIHTWSHVQALNCATECIVHTSLF